EDRHVVPAGCGMRLERRFQRERHEAADAQRAVERVLPARGHGLTLADKATGLWAAEQLVAREEDEVGARGDEVGHGRLAFDPPTREIAQRSAPLVHDDRHAALATE